MKAFTRRRLLASVKLGFAAIPFSFILRLAHGAPIVPGTFILGFGIGFSVGVAELFFLRSRLKNLRFLPHLAAKSIAIVGAMWCAFAVLHLLDVAIDGISWQEYAVDLFEPDTAVGILEALVVVTFLLFFVQLDRLLGPGVLLGYVTGRYHHPRREERIFMFLDLKGSTTLADEMDADRYFGFLHQYFVEMSEPILETNGEIYEYVGDEVVLTWNMKSGLEEANCVRAFFLIRDRIRSRREHFLEEYGVAPEFKAGMHAGEVITAQIGELKSEIVYNGDVLNTTARIQASCNELGRSLLVSRELVDQLDLGMEYVVEPLGAVKLRGKVEAVELCAVETAALVPPLAEG